MLHFLGFSRIARDSKIDARERVKTRHFRAKSQHLDALGGKSSQVPMQVGMGVNDPPLLKAVNACVTLPSDEGSSLMVARSR